MSPDAPPTEIARSHDRMRGLIEADPVVLLEIAAAIAGEGEGAWPAERVTEIAAEHAQRLAEADKGRTKTALETMLMGRDVDEALEWLRATQILPVLFPELAATIDLVQETGRQHKDVWAHTKQVVRQTVRRPLVRVHRKRNALVVHRFQRHTDERSHSRHGERAA